jgi:hypothetical protein
MTDETPAEADVDEHGEPPPDPTDDEPDADEAPVHEGHDSVHGIDIGEVADEEEESDG